MAANINTLQFQIIGGGSIKSWGEEGVRRGGGGGEEGVRGPTDNLNINKRDGPNKRGSLKNVFRQKWQHVISNYGCPRQLLIVEKHQYNFSWSLRLYIKQNRTFLIANLQH